MSGNLFLTCLRLRFEEAGSWSEVWGLKTSEKEDILEQEDITSSASEINDTRVKPSWKQWLERAFLRKRSGTRAFGAAGSSLQLSPHSQDGILNVAERTGNSLNGVAVTTALASKDATWSPSQRFYFEFEVEVLEILVADTLEIGFVWEPPQANDLPEVAHQLPQSVVMGGDLPHTFLDGSDLGKVSGWRPLIHVMRTSVIGALLEVRAPRGSEAGSLLFKVYQDNSLRAERRCEPRSWHGSKSKPPHGVVDVRGCVRRVRLLDSSCLF
uniref:Uncharacterized protein n=1 Tax=Noctiluca scintillans TaxID=2966 RepID=A0A7S0ZQT8_NOCSC